MVEDVLILSEAAAPAHVKVLQTEKHLNKTKEHFFLYLISSKQRRLRVRLPKASGSGIRCLAQPEMTER